MQQASEHEKEYTFEHCVLRTHWPRVGAWLDLRHLPSETAKRGHGNFVTPV
jgi:hypothetical protein